VLNVLIYSNEQRKNTKNMCIETYLWRIYQLQKKHLLPYLQIRLNSLTPESLQIKCNTYISWIGTDAVVAEVVVTVTADRRSSCNLEFACII
jgi:hypothetical protein